MIESKTKKTGRVIIPRMSHERLQAKLKKALETVYLEGVKHAIPKRMVRRTLAQDLETILAACESRQTVTIDGLATFAFDLGSEDEYLLSVTSGDQPQQKLISAFIAEMGCVPEAWEYHFDLPLYPEDRTDWVRVPLSAFRDPIATVFHREPDSDYDGLVFEDHVFEALKKGEMATILEGDEDDEDMEGDLYIGRPGGSARKGERRGGNYLLKAEDSEAPVRSLQPKAPLELRFSMKTGSFTPSIRQHTIAEFSMTALQALCRKALL